jgi:hypothetical protein
MRTDGQRVALLCAFGIPVAIAAAIYLPDTPSDRPVTQVVVAFVLAGGLSAVVWLAVSSRQVDRAPWVAMGVVGLAAFGLSLSVRHGDPMEAVLGGVFWWFAGVLFVVPAGQAIRAIQRARRAVRQAAYGQGESGVESRQ